MDYQNLCTQLHALTDGIPYETANLSNAAALLWQELETINWAGFYKIEDGALILGPFQGKPACIRIEIGRGVCGSAVAQDRVLRIADVHTFPGHIACDSASNSEIVIPIHVGDRIWGVLDIDSPEFNRFSDADQAGLEGFVRILEAIL